MNRALRLYCIAALALSALLPLCSVPAQAAIPDSERTALLHFYASTNGATWTRSTNWNGIPGTECTWWGVTCSIDGSAVTGINLGGNNLTGSFPDDLNALTKLISFNVGLNKIAGSIPALAGMTSLMTFEVSGNRLSGTIPPVSSLTSLVSFYVAGNFLSGTLPPLSGLSNLQTFVANGNQLTGSIPSLAGLSSLGGLQLQNNQLTGPIPDLTGLHVGYINVANNRLTGPIPPLPANIGYFYADHNQLTGSIPPLAGLSNLNYFIVSTNQLTGSIPALTGLTSLGHFDVSFNQLTGPIPPLASLVVTQEFFANNNQLSGPIPSLAAMVRLNEIDLGYNQLTGNVPPGPPQLAVLHDSNLCPNFLNHTPDPAWDTATGQMPWYTHCTDTGNPPPTLANANFQGLWWNAAESGWGVNLAHQGDRIFATWYTYDTGGNAYWLSMLADRTTPTGSVYSGDVHATVGPPFTNFLGPATPTTVGTGTLTFTDANTGSFSYRVTAGGATNVNQTKAITRFVIDAGTAQPVCTYSTTPDLAGATNYQDLWWNSNEPGWGINLAHQGNLVFVTWYTYDVNGPVAGHPPLWLSGLLKRIGSSNYFGGTLTRTSGPRFDNYMAPFGTQDVGMATVGFTDGNHGTFSWVTNGTGGLPLNNNPQTRTIMRFLFAAQGGTTCP